MLEFFDALIINLCHIRLGLLLSLVYGLVSLACGRTKSLSCQTSLQQSIMKVFLRKFPFEWFVCQHIQGDSISFRNQLCSFQHSMHSYRELCCFGHNIFRIEFVINKFYRIIPQSYGSPGPHYRVRYEPVFGLCMAIVSGSFRKGELCKSK